jgi:hypothetical protein
LTVNIEVTGYWSLSRERLNKFYKELNPLCLLERIDLARIKIRLHTHWEGPHTTEGDEREMLNLLEVLRHPVYELPHAGCKVTVQQYNGSEQEEVQDDIDRRQLTRFGYGAIAKSPSDFFQLTAEEWAKV